jgi:predicted phage-related endonuclease
MLWAEMTGRVHRDESEAMRWGTLLEPVILGELRERGYIVTSGHGDALADPERPWLVGHPDGYVWEDERPPALLEVKTASAWARWTDRIPLTYEAQMQVYFHLTHHERGLLACLIGGQRLAVREVERSQHAIDAMLELMAEFVGYVQRDEPPPPDASDSARDALLALYPEHTPEKVVRLTREQMKGVYALRERRIQLDTIKEQASGLENELRAIMGDAEVAESPDGDPVAAWRSYDDHRVDSTRLKAELPEVAAQFTNVTRRRRFTLS